MRALPTGRSLATAARKPYVACYPSHSRETPMICVRSLLTPLRFQSGFLGLAALCVTFVASPALAQTDIATYQGADRTQQLVEGAKKEGTLAIYTSATTEDMAALTSAFEKKFGVKTQVWRASSENI